MQVISTLGLITKDLIVYTDGTSMHKRLLTVLFSIEFQAIASHKLIHVLAKSSRFSLFIATRLYLQRRISACYISPTATIAVACRLPHPVRVVISRNALIGNKVRIYQHVTIGSTGRTKQNQTYPIICDDVVIYAGAVVLGSVTLGQGSVVGSGAVVLSDVPPYSVVVGSLARIVKQQSFEQRCDSE